jgi:predicted nucleic-acid-binding Zn-ribbon protein
MVLIRFFTDECLETWHYSSCIQFGGNEMASVGEQLSAAFRCPKCNQHGAHVERLSMSGTGISRLFEIQPYRYAFASCHNCGYTEIYNLTTLEGKDNLGDILDIIFLD